jgi:hypothetical protein
MANLDIFLHDVSTLISISSLFKFSSLHLAGFISANLLFNLIKKYISMFRLKKNI